MGYVGKLEEKRKAMKLRKQGLSYSEIKKQVPVSKATLSIWCREVILSAEQFERLAKRKLVGAEKGRFINSKKQQQKRIEDTQRLFSKGKKEIGRLNKRERFLIGVALYAAEGTKTDRQVVFSNSDPKLIKFMADWFREFCKIDNAKLRGRLWIHENRDQEKAKIFWSNLIKIPINQFQKTYVAENKINSKKIRKKIHEFGVLGVSFSSSEIHRKIMGWIAGISS